MDNRLQQELKRLKDAVRGTNQAEFMGFEEFDGKAAGIFMFNGVTCEISVASLKRYEQEDKIEDDWAETGILKAKGEWELGNINGRLVVSNNLNQNATPKGLQQFKARQADVAETA